MRPSRKTFAMNLPEPSGSSPPENPPASAKICAPFNSRSSISSESSRARGVLFAKTAIFVSAPATANARAISYSQFVPGKTGMSTRTFFVGAAKLFLPSETQLLKSASEGCAASAKEGSAGRAGLSDTGGNTFESFDSHAFSASESEIFVYGIPAFLSLTTISLSAIVSPILTIVPETKPALSISLSASGAASKMIEPYCGVKRSSEDAFAPGMCALVNESGTASMRPPIPFPIIIFVRASAMPPEPTGYIARMAPAAFKR